MHLFCSFSYSFSLIPPDSPSDSPSISTSPSKSSNTLMKDSVGKPREDQSSDKTREFRSTPTLIPAEPSDFSPLKNKPIQSDFKPSSSPTTIKADADIAAMQRKRFCLLTYHERFGYLSFSVLKLMAQVGLIPRDLANVDPPTCPGCAYGKAIRKKWRHKGMRNNRHIKIATAPGQVVSMDQLVSPTPGFVPIHRGRPTNQRYVGATVFVDHYSDLTYVHLMTELNAEKTVEAKRAFERLAASHQVVIKHYHADNGLFDTKAFWSDIKSSNQTMSFCGVNAHHQNGKAERRIRDITTQARTSLLHAAHRWPKAIHASL